MSLTVTAADLRALLNGPSQEPVLYVERDEETREPVRLAVWDKNLVPYQDAVALKADLVDVLTVNGDALEDADLTDEGLEDVLPVYQATLDEILEG
ncbi:hypothetical protein [Streptomyces sp. NPDC088752]|uniref:hypothetical protein n=1 Tax=Streptomyces sp. NPDC088752 TaxID=3154963 RepID=UPI00342D57CE